MEVGRSFWTPGGTVSGSTIWTSKKSQKGEESGYTTRDWKATDLARPGGITAYFRKDDVVDGIGGLLLAVLASF